MSLPVGIDSIAVSAPRSYLDLSDLAEARGVPAAKYTTGLGTIQMAIAAADEDPVTLAANAARRLFHTSGVDPREVGMCIVGTETAVDHSKPIASFLHGLLGLPSACRVFDTKHACFGGTAGLLNAVDWIAAGSARGRSALIVCSDIARYELGTAGEPTQGAGAVAMLVRERPRILDLDVGRTGSYSRHVHDFWRPLDRKDALVDGHFSVQCYLDAVGGAYADWRALEGEGSEPLARACYHVPYGKMARKAHRHRLKMDGQSDEAADESFATEVEASLRLPSVVGNTYTASLYFALASLLHAEAGALEGRRIGLFSYGSGCGAAFFAGRVAAGAAAWVKGLRLDEPLSGRRRLTFAEYEEIRRCDSAGERRRAPNGATLAGSIPENVVSFLGIDAGERRVYAQ